MVLVLAWAESPPGWESLELILLRQGYGGQVLLRQGFHLRQGYGGQDGGQGVERNPSGECGVRSGEWTRPRSSEGFGRALTDWDLWGLWEEWDLLLRLLERKGKMPVSRCRKWDRTRRS